MSVARAFATAAAIACAGCTPPPAVPPTDQPPEPQASGLRDAIQAPIEKAKAAGDAVQDAADRQRGAIDDAGG